MASPGFSGNDRPNTTENTLTRIITHTVMKNEVTRYLREFMESVVSFADVNHFYDDQSTDGTWEYVNYNTNDVLDEFYVGKRREGPSFLEHEGKFRQAAWDHMVETVQPEEGDFIVCLDADEFLVSYGTVREDLETQFQDPTMVLTVQVVEIFGFDGDVPLVRTDGEWGNILGSRIVRYSSERRTFADVPLAGGSVPGRHTGRLLVQTPLILHLGYATNQARIDKHERYKNLGGHSRKHIDSIVEPAQLEPWTGPTPSVWNEPPW